MYKRVTIYILESDAYICEASVKALIGHLPKDCDYGVFMDPMSHEQMLAEFKGTLERKILGSQVAFHDADDDEWTLMASPNQPEDAS